MNGRVRAVVVRGANLCQTSDDSSCSPVTSVSGDGFAPLWSDTGCLNVVCNSQKGFGLNTASASEQHGVAGSGGGLWRSQTSMCTGAIPLLVSHEAQQHHTTDLHRQLLQCHTVSQMLHTQQQHPTVSRSLNACVSWLSDRVRCCCC